MHRFFAQPRNWQTVHRIAQRLIATGHATAAEIALDCAGVTVARPLTPPA